MEFKHKYLVSEDLEKFVNPNEWRSSEKSSYENAVEGVVGSYGYRVWGEWGWGAQSLWVMLNVSHKHSTSGTKLHTPTKETSRDMNKRLQSLAAPKSGGNYVKGVSCSDFYHYHHHRFRTHFWQFATMETSALIAQEYCDHHNFSQPASPAILEGASGFVADRSTFTAVGRDQVTHNWIIQSPNSSIIQPQRNIDSVLRCPPPSKDFVGREKILQKLSRLFSARVICITCEQPDVMEEIVARIRTWSE
ncbi:hypothetical protein BDP27DRAFT_1370565 [Rhodocollybia butyracea]|uniref:Uncharacterized protein n=1 Tax=Rhodocollybia butyracea TaxID=206335 RepID=A0A9P5TYG1_9AGAR|nr:hypothetical protein BDP27DRAFT_1370565 [Rhodocollybia butyracea]